MTASTSGKTGDKDGRTERRTLDCCFMLSAMYAASVIMRPFRPVRWPVPTHCGYSVCEMVAPAGGPSRHVGRGQASYFGSGEAQRAKSRGPKGGSAGEVLEEGEANLLVTTYGSGGAL